MKDYKLQNNKLVKKESVELSSSFTLEELSARRQTFVGLAAKHREKAAEFDAKIAETDADIAKAEQLGAKPKARDTKDHPAVEDESVDLAKKK